jgi:2-dehydro-3-deoxygalactonokinase
MIVVDWGTTNLRVFVCKDDGSILKTGQSMHGIKTVSKDGYGTVLNKILEEIGERNDLPVFICGMAGARGGWREAPYCQTPISLQDISANLTPLPDGFDGYLLPGGRTLSPDGTSDVMRGEEIQIFGAMAHFGVLNGVLCVSVLDGLSVLQLL